MVSSGLLNHCAVPLTTGVMGPRVRGDDGRGFGISTAEKTCLRFLAALLRPSCSSEPPSINKRAQGRPGADCTRGSRAKKHGGRTTGSTGSTGLPCAMVYGLLRALPGDRAFLPPSPPGNCFPGTLRQHRGARTTRLRRPRPPRSSVVASASIASHRNARDDRDPPLIWVRRAESKH
jgi:hypothetical protein